MKLLSSICGDWIMEREYGMNGALPNQLQQIFIIHVEDHIGLDCKLVSLKFKYFAIIIIIISYDNMYSL